MSMTAVIFNHHSLYSNPSSSLFYPPSLPTPIHLFLPHCHGSNSSSSLHSPTAPSLSVPVPDNRLRPRHQLRPDRQQPPPPGVRPPPRQIHGRRPHQALRRRPSRPESLRQHRRRVHRRPRQRIPRLHGSRSQAGAGLGQVQRPVLPPCHQNHLHCRRQRSPHLQRLRPLKSPPSRHGEHPLRPNFLQSRQTGLRHHRAQFGDFGGFLPPFRGRIPPRFNSEIELHPRFPLQNRIPVPNQRLPLLRLQIRSEAYSARFRAIRGFRYRGSGYGAPLRQHVPRPNRRRAFRDGEARVQIGLPAGLGDGVAVEGGRRRGWGHAGECEDVQREPAQADFGEEGDADEAEFEFKHLCLRSVQRESEARPDVGAEFRAFQARRDAGVQSRVQSAGVGEYELAEHGWEYELAEYDAVRAAAEWVPVHYSRRRGEADSGKDSIGILPHDFNDGCCCCCIAFLEFPARSSGKGRDGMEKGNNGECEVVQKDAEADLEINHALLYSNLSL